MFLAYRIMFLAGLIGFGDWAICKILVKGFLLIPFLW